MDELLERPELEELSAEQLEPIERRIKGWPEFWRNLARSLFMTLHLSGENALPADAAVRLAVALTLGVTNDMGGTQVYIAAGSDMARDGMSRRIVELLQVHRQNYSRVATLVGLSERTVRRLEMRWLRAERARRQRCLDLGPDEAGLE